jgi:hypothetical protein
MAPSAFFLVALVMWWAKNMQAKGAAKPGQAKPAAPAQAPAQPAKA